jgi:hypothetical protein
MCVTDVTIDSAWIVGAQASRIHIEDTIFRGKVNSHNMFDSF